MKTAAIFSKSETKFQNLLRNNDFISEHFVPYFFEHKGWQNLISQNIFWVNQVLSDGIVVSGKE